VKLASWLLVEHQICGAERLFIEVQCCCKIGGWISWTFGQCRKKMVPFLCLYLHISQPWI